MRTRSRNDISCEFPSGGVRTPMSVHSQRSVMRGFNSMRLQGSPHIEAMHVLMIWYSHVSMIGGDNHHGDRGSLTYRLRVGAELLPSRHRESQIFTLAYRDEWGNGLRGVRHDILPSIATCTQGVSRSCSCKTRATWGVVASTATLA